MLAEKKSKLHNSNTVRIGVAGGVDKAPHVVRILEDWDKEFVVDWFASELSSLLGLARLGCCGRV